MVASSKQRQRELLDPRADIGALLDNDLFREAFDLSACRSIEETKTQ